MCEAREDRKSAHRENKNSPFSALLFYTETQGLPYTQPIWCGQMSLLSLMIQMLVSSRNTFTDTTQKQCLTSDMGIP